MMSPPQMKAGVDSVAGVEGTLFQFAETLPEEVLTKMHAPPKAADVPVISVSDLSTADGFLFGFGTRFGIMPAQVKALFDATGQLWVKGALVGKPAGLFVGTNSQGGGQEVTAFSTIPFLAAHGMPFVPIGYSFGQKQFSTDAVRGGSGFGAGTFAGADGSRTPSEDELAMAFHQGQFMGRFIKRLDTASPAPGEGGATAGAPQS